MKNIFLFISMLFLLSCSDKADDLVTPALAPQAVNPADLSLTIAKDNIASDGVQASEILFKAGPSVTSKYSEVSFDIAPLGKFSNGVTNQKLTLDATGEARVYATSTAQGLATVKATIGNLSKQATAKFVTSWPDQLLINPSVSALPAQLTSKTQIQARLIRINGIVSPRLTVVFYDSAINHPSIGSFLNTTKTDSQGAATSEYWLQDTSYKGFVYIKGYVTTDTGRITGFNKILIQ